MEIHKQDFKENQHEKSALVSFMWLSVRLAPLVRDKKKPKRDTIKVFQANCESERRKIWPKST